MQKSYPLPPPGTPDVWMRIANETRPLILYGMGNGGDKLLDRLAGMGLTPAAVMASDAFVRGQSFRGFRVEKYSDVIARFGGNICILEAFATRQADMLTFLGNLSKKHTLYLPDMPVVGEEYFTADFYAAHYGEFCLVYDLLQDKLSKKIFCSVIEYKLTGDIRPLLAAFSTPDEDYACLAEKPIRYAVDAGAYNGDTVRELLTFQPSVKEILAFEPDARTYKKLELFAAESGSCVTPVHAALGASCGTVQLAAAGNRNSSIHGHSHEFRTQEVVLTTVDFATEGKTVDFIKYDVEGAEEEALCGSQKTILRDRPSLAVSLYHRSADLFRLPLLLQEWRPDYRFFLRRRACLPAWEITLYAV